MPSQSCFLTHALCERVFATLRESFEAVLKQEGREALAFAVINQTLTSEQVESRLMEDPTWSSVLLWEDHVGESDNLTAYIENARLKAKEAHFYKETLTRVWANRPACLRVGMIAWKGGVYLDGIAFGGSGLNEVRDEEEVYRLARKVADEVKLASQWPTPEARVAQIREWGGRLPEAP